MFNFSAYTIDGTEIKLLNVIEYVYTAELSKQVPTISLKAIIDMPVQLKRLVVTVNTTVFFDGLVSNQGYDKSNNGHILWLKANHKNIILFTNEIMPCTYEALSTRQLMQKYCEPLGNFTTDFPYETSIAIEAYKNTNNWEFIEQYCLQAFNKLPYLSKDSVILFSPLTSKSHVVLDPTDISEVEYIYNRDKVISGVTARRRDEQNVFHYDVRATNPHTTALGITRERYLYPEYDKNVTLMSHEAKQDIIRSSRDLKVIKVSFHIPYLADVGDRFAVNQSQVENTYIAKAVHSYNSKLGNVSTFWLYDSRYAT